MQSPRWKMALTEIILKKNLSTLLCVIVYTAVFYVFTFSQTEQIDSILLLILLHWPFYRLVFNSLAVCYVVMCLFVFHFIRLFIFSSNMKTLFFLVWISFRNFSRHISVGTTVAKNRARISFDTEFIGNTFVLLYIFCKTAFVYLSKNHDLYCCCVVIELTFFSLSQTFFHSLLHSNLVSNFHFTDH